MRGGEENGFLKFILHIRYIMCGRHGPLAGRAGRKCCIYICEIKFKKVMLQCKKAFLSGAQGKNSSAKWLHLTVFYVLFHSVDPKKYWSNGQQGKNLT